MKIPIILPSMILPLLFALSLPAADLFHGASIQDRPDTADLSGPIHILTIGNLDDYGDTHTITNITVTTHHQFGDNVSANLTPSPITLEPYETVELTNHLFILPGDEQLPQGILEYTIRAYGLDNHDGGTGLAQSFYLDFSDQIYVAPQGAAALGEPRGAARIVRLGTTPKQIYIDWTGLQVGHTYQVQSTFDRIEWTRRFSKTWDGSAPAWTTSRFLAPPTPTGLQAAEFFRIVEQ